MVKKSIAKNIYDYLLIIAGCIVLAGGFNFFLIPNKVVIGGFAGFAQTLHYQFPVIKIGLTSLLLNIPLFLLGLRVLGASFGFKTVVGAFLLGLFIDVLGFLPSLTQNKLLAALYGGLLIGFGMGIIFKAGGTTGGSDLAARIIHRKLPSFTIGQVLLFIDTLIVLYAAVVEKDSEIILFAVVALFTSSKVIDIILEGVNYAKAAYIISDRYKVIADHILHDLDRGVTGLKGIGMYTNKEKNVLLCIVKRAQLQDLKAVVKHYDPKAFIIVSDVKEVLGEGFKE